MGAERWRWTEAKHEWDVVRKGYKRENRLFIEEFFPLTDMLTFKAGQSLFFVKVILPNSL